MPAVQAVVPEARERQARERQARERQAPERQAVQAGAVQAGAQVRAGTARPRPTIRAPQPLRIARSCRSAIRSRTGTWRRGVAIAFRYFSAPIRKAST